MGQKSKEALNKAAQSPSVTDRELALLRLPEVERQTGLARATIYRKIKSQEFPAPVRLGARCSRWSSAAVRDWIKAQVQEVGQ